MVAIRRKGEAFRFIMLSTLILFFDRYKYYPWLVSIVEEAPNNCNTLGLKPGLDQMRGNIFHPDTDKATSKL